jgi:glucosamine--fructose-6-phosphate aminotransferase (isomerizing)
MSKMMQEIHQQPQVLRRTLKAEAKHASDFQKFAAKHRFRLIVLAARGTSANAALFGRYLLEVTTGIPVSLCASSVHTVYHAPLDFRQTLVVGISQSGIGADTNHVLELARRRGAVTLGITSETDSPITQIADEVFLVRGGQQRTVTATKSYTGQLLALYLLASALGSQVTLEGISEIPDRVAEVLNLEKDLRSLVSRYRYMRQCVIVARGLNFANALEMAQKLMEICRVGAEPFSAADFLYGPIAMIEGGFPAFVFMPPGKTITEMKKLTRRLSRLGADILVIGPEEMAGTSGMRCLRMPDTLPEIYAPIPYIVPAQMFASLLAEIKGLDPDKPRSLQKVTLPL